MYDSLEVVVQRGKAEMPRSSSPASSPLRLNVCHKIHGVCRLHIGKPSVMLIVASFETWLYFVAPANREDV